MDIFTMNVVVGVVIYGFIFAFGCRYVAQEKGKDPNTWFWIGFFLGLIGLLIIGFSRTETNTQISNVTSSDNMNTPLASQTQTINDVVRYFDINCPVEVENVVISVVANMSFPYCTVEFFNLSNREVSSLKFNIVCYDSFGSPVGEVPNNQIEAILQDESAEPETSFGSDKNIPLSNHPSTRRVDIVITKILFSDGTVWEKTDDKLYPIEIDKITDSKELSYLQDIAGKDAICYSYKTDNTWMCVCGRLNRDTDETCRRCNRGRDSILECCSSSEIIVKEIMLRKEQFELDEKKRKEEENLYKQERIEQRKKIMKKAIPITLVIAIISFIGVTGTATDWTFSYKHYELKQLNSVDANGDTPLLRAVKAGDIDSAKSLINKGVALDVKNKDGRNALFEAIRKPNNIELINLLIEKGANINIKDNGGYDILQEAIIQSRDDLVMVLLEKGVDINYVDNNGSTVLHLAVERGDKELTKLLLGKGIKINTLDKYGRTPLQYAVSYGENEICKLLIQNGANINIKDKDGNTALNLAIEHKNIEMVEALLKGGTGSNITNSNEYGQKTDNNKLEYMNYKNNRYGFLIDYPRNFSQGNPPFNGDGLEFISQDGKAKIIAYGTNHGSSEPSIEDICNSELKEIKGNIEYKVLKNNWFIITWKDNGIIYYRKTISGVGSHNTFIISYPEDKANYYNDVVKVIESTFKPGDLSNSH